MLLLKQSEANKIVLSLQQLVTITNPNYLFSFFHQQKREYFNFYLTAQSVSNRFDLFLLSLPSDADLPKGNFLYYVYESEDATITTEGKNLLAQGKAEVVTEFPVGDYYTINTTNSINYVQ